MSAPDDKSTESSAFLQAQAQGQTPAPTPPDLPLPIEGTGIDKLPLNAAVRTALISQAQFNYTLGFGTRPQTVYERELAEEQKQLDTYFTAHGAKDDHAAVILDPIQYDIGKALRVPGPFIISGMIDQDVPDRDMPIPPGVQAPPGLKFYPRSSAYNTEALQQAMESPFTSKFGGAGTTQKPERMPGYAPGSARELKGSVIVPASEKSDPTRVPGLSYADNLAYINAHERWHARDTRMEDNGVTLETLGKFNHSARIDDLPDDPAVRKAYALNNQMESFADVGAAGDMIRAGKSMAVLDAVLDWRRVPEDTAHYTVPALEELKRKIEEMGIDKFRKLSDDQARALYEKAVDDKALNGKDVEIIANGHSLNPIKFLPTVFSSDPEYQKARDFEHEQGVDAMNTIWRIVKGTAPIPVEPVLPANLKGWNPSKDLQDEAFAEAHKITPDTMISAYVKLQDGLENKARDAKDPAQAQVYAAQMTMLQKAFIDDLYTLDYLKLNQDRGVRLELAEPSLKPIFQMHEKDKPAAPVPAKPAASPRA